MHEKSRPGRSYARRAAVQALYRWQVNRGETEEILDEFLQDFLQKSFDVGYFRKLVNRTIERHEELDATMAPLLDRTLRELDPIEHVILLVGLCELVYHPSVPWRVVIDESVELAKLFGGEQSYKYVNGVLDKLARQLHPADRPS